MGSCHLRPPVFVMPSDKSLPIIDLTYRRVLEVDRAVGHPPAEMDESAALADDRGSGFLTTPRRRPGLPKGAGGLARRPGRA